MDRTAQENTELTRKALAQNDAGQQHRAIFDLKRMLRFKSGDISFLHITLDIHHLVYAVGIDPAHDHSANAWTGRQHHLTVDRWRRGYDSVFLEH